MINDPSPMIDSEIPKRSRPAGASRAARLFLLRSVLVIAFWSVVISASFAADPPPADVRLGPLKDLDGYFPFKVPATRAEWETRAEEVRKRILVSQGLFPQPTKTPLNAVVHGRIEREDYTVEKVFFEAMPGFFVTGNLYRPLGKPGPHPAVLCAHGHWADARFMIRGDAEMKKELESGGEKLPESGRSIFQSLCVQLARMGCVAFMYDMIGNSDSQQLSAELAHGFKKQRPEASSPDGWGFFSAQAELRCQSIMGLQTWSSIRAIDFVTSLPDVDAKRIGMTGASGGGTQTFIASAIDPRISVAVPCVMVSTAMQGGCTCENASLLRIGTGNVEFAALFAPKPLAMTAADDWTKEMETKGFPELKQLYTLMGAPDNVALWPQLQFGHNYNAPTREHIYSWLNKHFALGLPEPVVERDYPMLPREQLTVWDAEYPAPKETGLELEKRLLRWWDEDSKRQIAEKPEILRQAWRVLIGRGQEAPEKKVDVPNRVIWLTGRAGSLENRDHVLKLDGRSIIPSLIGEGEITQQRLVKNPREALAYTLGYNDSIFAQRVHDVLATVAAPAPNRIKAIIASGHTGPIAAAAAALAGEAVDGIAIEASDEHPFAKITDWRDPNLLPGAVKYGDLEALIKMIAPRPVILFKNDAERSAAIEKLVGGPR
jgi:dienelactone hydrolase